MKLITRCTQCHTSFRVHDHQLAVRQGRVRCGACGHVFDAYSTLTEQPDEERAAFPVEWQIPSATPPTQESAGTHGRSREDPLSPTDPIFDVGTAQPPDRTPANKRDVHEHEDHQELERALQENALGVQVRTGAAGDHVLPPRPSPEQLGAAGYPAIAPSPDGFRSAGTDVVSYSIADPLAIPPGPSEPAIVPEPPPPVLDEQFDFGPRRASRKARVAMGVGAGLLTVLMLGQLVFATRSYIAAWSPSARPVLQDLCAALGCEVPLLRQTEAVMLDSSELEREEAGLLTLNAVIRNTSMFEQALPSLMLTLLDDRNRAISRRIVDPKEYVADAAANADVLPALGAVQATVYIDATKLGQSAANYEVMVFYR